MVMASAGVNNMPEGPIDSEECRLRRRRRLHPRRYVHAASASSSSAPAPAEEGQVLSPPPSSSSSSSSSEESSQDGAEAEVSGAADAVAAARVAPKLPAGASTAAASWPVAFGSVALAGRLREMEDTVSLHPSFCAWADGSPMHFFAVRPEDAAVRRCRPAFDRSCSCRRQHLHRENHRYELEPDPFAPVFYLSSARRPPPRWPSGQRRSS